MTQPRPVAPGTSYFITRRCSQREFLMVPDAETRNAFAYILAFASQKSGVRVHAAEMMSNHYHCVVTDVEGRIPEFFQTLHHHFAKFQNAKHDRGGGFWETTQTYAAVLGDGIDVLRKSLYTLANPLRAGIVEKAEEWIGLRAIWTNQNQSRIDCTRPARYFDKNSWPETLTLELSPPSDREDSVDKDDGFISADLRTIEIELAEKRKRERTVVWGIKHALSLGPGDFPRTPEKRRSIKPKVIAHDLKLRRELGLQLRGFQAEHRVCYENLRLGKPRTFPQHTWKWHVLGGYPREGEAFSRLNE